MAGRVRVHRDAKRVRGFQGARRHAAVLPHVLPHDGQDGAPRVHRGAGHRDHGRPTEADHGGAHAAVPARVRPEDATDDGVAAGALQGVRAVQHAGGRGQQVPQAAE